MCAPHDPTVDGPRVPKGMWAVEAFHTSWETFSKRQTEVADEGRRRFLARFEYQSLWETQEMYDHRMDLYNQEASIDVDAEDEEPAATSEGLTCEDHDVGKERATVAQYVAIVGAEVAINLEGLACARVEKPKKQRETDAHVQEAYMKLTSGGGLGDGRRRRKRGCQSRRPQNHFRASVHIYPMGFFHRGTYASLFGVRKKNSQCIW